MLMVEILASTAQHVDYEARRSNSADVLNVCVPFRCFECLQRVDNGRDADIGDNA